MAPANNNLMSTAVFRATSWVFLAILCLPYLTACYTCVASIPPEELPKLNKAHSPGVASDLMPYTYAGSIELYDAGGNHAFNPVGPDSEIYVKTTDGEQTFIKGEYFNAYVIKKNGDEIEFEYPFLSAFSRDTLTIIPKVLPQQSFNVAEIDHVEIHQQNGLLVLGGVVLGGVAIATLLLLAGGVI